MNQTEIVIPKGLYSKLLNTCRSELPYEACGLLAGTSNQIKSLWPMKNELRSTNRFFVSKYVVEDTMKKINSLKQEIFAIYHTHPNTAAIPSTIDIMNHHDESVDMVIISFKYHVPMMKWYTIDDSSYRERPFLII
ncbi:Mov34/MPN/PAD-1 family protein [Ornithinibacillus sp. 179-J 7C1 HS]|uniref:Mov34/MPN/PAD-1 family protein n=1 Tax=Ornithinibacillus sp. 179-J 7C1 HS TaxID=3142384 RepID=UPI0039A0E0E8